MACILFSFNLRATSVREHSIWNSVNPVLSPCSGEKLGLGHSFTGHREDWPLSSGAFPWRLAVCGWSDRDLTLAGTSEAILGRCSEHPGWGGSPVRPSAQCRNRAGSPVPDKPCRQPLCPSCPPCPRGQRQCQGRQDGRSPTLRPSSGFVSLGSVITLRFP